MIRYKKWKYLSSSIKENKSNPKQIHKIIKSSTGAEKPNPLPTGFKNDKELAQVFADFFVNKIETIQNNLQHYPIYQPTQRDISQKLSNFEMLNQQEVFKLVMKMQTKSCEADVLPTRIIKDNILDFLPTLTDIVNLSLQEGTFIPEWRKAIIRPLIKKINGTLELKNYRPVSNLQFISKLVECAMLQQLNSHCEKYHLNPSYQSAYRANHSCETAVLKLTDDILWTMENKNIKIMVCLDNSAAFDTVNHQVLLSVMRDYYGVDGTVLTWLKSYLQDRQMCVNIRQEYSEPKTFNYSVPQGSCSGAQIFSWYSSTLENHLEKHIDLNAHADDHTINKDFDPDQPIQEKETLVTLSTSIHTIGDWMNENRLKLNKDKTEIIYFGSKKQLAKCEHVNKSVQMDDELIQTSPCVRYVGTWFDNELNFYTHAIKKSKAAMLNLLLIKNIRNFIDFDTCQILISCLVMSHLDYCNAVLIGCSDKCINILQRVQNIAAKILTKSSKFASNTELFKKLHWLPIRKRCEFKCMCLIWKCLNQQGPEYLTNKITLIKDQKYSLRSAQQVLLLDVPRVSKSNFAWRSFSVFGPRQWNQLPNSVKASDSYESFKKSLKTHYFNILYNNDNVYLYY